MASATAVEFPHVVIAVQQAEARSLDPKRGKDEAEQEKAEEETILFS